MSGELKRLADGCETPTHVWGPGRHGSVCKCDDLRTALNLLERAVRFAELTYITEDAGSAVGQEAFQWLAEYNAAKGE